MKGECSSMVASIEANLVVLEVEFASLGAYLPNCLVEDLSWVQYLHQAVPPWIWFSSQTR